MSAAFNQFLNLHHHSNDSLRLGQRFVNMYFKYPYYTDFANKLFYADYDTARAMIQKWLVEHHYDSELPK